MIDGWEKSTLGHHIDLLTGYPFKSSEYSEEEGTIRLLRGDNIIQGIIRWEGVKRWKKTTDSKLQKYFLAPGDFVIAMDRTWVKAGLKASLITEKDTPSLLVQRVARLRAKNGLHGKLLPILIRSHRFEQYVKGVQTESAVPHISPSQIKEFSVLLPPLREQKAIADLLTTWDEAIEDTERLIRAKQKNLKGQVQKLISQRCDSWTHIKPREIFDTITEKNFPDEELLSVTQDRGVLPRSMSEGRVMSPDGTTANYKLIKRGDFAISLRSFQGGIEYSHYRGIISPAYTVLRAKVELDSDFYRLFFKSYIFIEKYLSLAVIGIRDGKQISVPDFLSIKIPVPPLKEQQKIAEVLTSSQQELGLLKQLAIKYKKQKRGLMQKLLTGEWRVKPEIVNQYRGAS